MKYVCSVTVVVVGPAGFFDVYDLESGRYLAKNLNKQNPHDSPFYTDFEFWKEGKKWRTNTFIDNHILGQIVEEIERIRA
jgi:hypothetical protein